MGQKLHGKQYTYLIYLNIFSRDKWGLFNDLLWHKTLSREKVSMVPKWVMDSSEKLPLLVISKQQIYSFPFSLCVCAC